MPASDEQSETGTYRCVECGAIRNATRFDLDDEEDFVAVLDHFLEEHPRLETFREVVESTWVRVDCQQCDSEFYSPVKVGSEVFLAESFCSECANHFNAVKQLVVRDLSAEDVLERHVDPTETDVGRDAEWHLDEDPGVDHV